MIRDLHIDVLLLQEIGVNWAKVGAPHQWKARASKYLDPNHSRSFMSYNTRTILPSPSLPGGTGVVTYGGMAHIGAGAGSDKAKLGRWTWTRYQGKQNSILRCVSIYRPCVNNGGPKTVSAQHRQYLQSINDDRDPRAAFLEDFEAELQTWIAKGDHIIVGGDLNQDVLHPDIQELFNRNGMSNAIGERHDLSQAPATFMYGNQVIDGLWSTPGVRVRQCGFFAPGDNNPGDHSLLWMDVSYESVLGQVPVLPLTFKARRLRLFDSKSVKKYLDRYQAILNEHHVLTRQIRLHQSIQYGVALTPFQAREANAIDELRTKAMLEAEKKCRKLKMGGVSFSLATEIPRRQIIFWNLAIKRRKGGRVSSKLWRRKKQKAQINESTRHMSLEDMVRNLRTAQQNYRNAKVNHRSEREGFLQSLSPKDRDRLLRVEKQRELGRAARRVTGKLEDTSVSRIIYQGREWSDKEDIERILLKVNEAKIRASEDTPFLQQPLWSEFGARNTTRATDEVLSGCYHAPEGVSRYAQDILRHMKRVQIPTKATQFQPRRIITMEDNTKAWRKAKERTSSGLSGLHFGMFKAHALRPHLSAFDASMRSIPYMTGFSYARWKKGLDVQLLKRKKDFRAEKLRTILLLEADSNMNNKALGSDAMKLGERHQGFAKDNYGGRKGHRSCEVGLNSCLTYDSVRARRVRAVVVSNDAKGCYDRISHTVLQLAMLRLGVPRPALQSMIETIQEMDHYICTAFGVSDNKYGFDPDRLPTQGVLQGNGAGPASWFAICSVLIDVMKSAGFGFSEWTIIRKIAIQLVLFAFVDDTDLVLVDNVPRRTREEVIEEAQRMVSTWHGLIRATGGDLAPEKSYWYCVELQWKNGKWQYKTIEESPGELWLPGSPQPIERREVTSPAEALGILARPDGNMCSEVQYLRKKVLAWTDRLRTGHIPKETAWYCLKATIMRTIEYPLAATTFSRQDVNSIMSPLLRVALNSVGIQKHLPRSLVYGSLRTRGLGIQDPFWTQLIQHLHVLLRHAHRDTPTRMLLDENMDLVQVYVGSEINFWELPFDLYGPLAPKGWIAHTWEALSSTPLVLKGPSLAIPHRRQHDVFLMDAFVDKSYDSATLAILNECRLYLHATTLADISSADGTVIDASVWAGRRMHSRRYDERRWIRSRDPGFKHWQCWRMAIRQTFLFPHQLHLRLRQPLGTWYLQRDETWKWWYHPRSNKLFCHHEDSTWSRASYRTQVGHRRVFNSDVPICLERVPNDLIRVSVQQPPGSPSITIENVGHAIEAPIPEVDTLQNALQLLPSECKWAFQHIQITDNGEAVARSICDGTAIAVSDGSLKFNLGAAAFIITESSHSHPIIGSHIVPGKVNDGDSLRCELSGLFGIVAVVHCMVQHFQIDKGAISVACDNKTALYVFDPDYLPDPKYTNFDLVNAIWHLLKVSPITWTSDHVMGHQDSKQRHRPLTYRERLNVQMDTMAKRTWIQHAHRGDHPDIPPYTPIFNEGWQLWSGTDKITNPSNDTLYDIFQGSPSQVWWVRHGHIPQEVIHDIDWDGTNDLMKSLSLAERRYITKNASNNCGIGTTLLQWKFQDDANCPRCGAIEDATHVYRCNGNDASTVWETNLSKLRSYLDSTDTCPAIQDALTSSVSAWRLSQPINLQPFDPPLRQAVSNQHAIGWKNLLEGLASNQWTNLQQQYYISHGIRKSSKRWRQGVLKRFVNLGRGQWIHRNDVKHTLLKPRHKRADQLLKRAIIWLYTRRTYELLPADRHQTDINLSDLLQRSVGFRQAWYLNIVSARNRYLRLRHGNPQLEDLPPHDQDIRAWIGGRPR